MKILFDVWFFSPFDLDCCEVEIHVPGEPLYTIYAIRCTYEDAVQLCLLLEEEGIVDRSACGFRYWIFKVSGMKLNKVQK